MRTNEIRKKYLEYFANRGHAVIPSASLVPENDPTTLFTGSGMQPLVPFLLGEPHPQGKRLTDSQKSFRSGDIDDIGDNRHTTFFEMLGNWSLGDYFKEEQLNWFFDFLTTEVGIDANHLYVTVFAGDENAGVPRDTESVDIWKRLFKTRGIEAKDVELLTEENGGRLGMQNGRIFYYDAKKNWWSRSGTPDKMPEGEPGGPDSEVFYEFTHIEHDKKFGEHCHPNCDCGRFLEIGNSVFMEYKRTAKGFEKLPQRNVDFGGGLERITAASENTSDVFTIDIFEHIIKELENRSGKKYSDPAHTASFRVIADHLRSSVFLIGDGVTPGNTEQNYFVRRLIRRAVRYADKIGIEASGLSSFVVPLLEFYKGAYPETYAKRDFIHEEIAKN
jgi:alanyl-tRNA synthetase